METYINQIELINDFLNNLLTGDSKSNFIKRLETDSEFNTLYQDHLIVVEGINRTVLKQEIANASQSYTTTKWMKITRIAVVVITIAVLVTILMLDASKTNHHRSEKPQTTPSINAELKTANTVGEQSDTTENTTVNSSSDSIPVNAILHPISAMQIIKKPPQILMIDASRDTIIVGKEGTKLNIKANSFVQKGTDKMVKGAIAIELTEYYKLLDILMANLTTTSNGEQLETGGMLNLKASSNGNQVELKQNASIEISFPYKKKKEDMQLFSGEVNDENINWILEDDRLDSKVAITNTPMELDIEVPFSLVEEVPVFPGCEQVAENQRRQCFSEGIQDYIQKNFNTGVTESLTLTGRQRISTMFKIDRDGDVVSIQSNAPNPKLEAEANRIIALLPKMRPGRQRGQNVTVPYSLPIIFQIMDDGQSSIAGTNAVNAIFLKTISIRDTLYVNGRGIVEQIREVMHDANFDVDDAFIKQWNLYKKQSLIRNFSKTSEPRFLIKKEVFEAKESRFRILEDDSITRGGHIIRIPWDESKIPTTSKIIQMVPRQTYTGGISAQEFETAVTDVEKTKSISAADVNYYILKTSTLGWINCDRFIRSKAKKIKFKLKIKNSDNTVVNMVFKSVNSVMPSKKLNDEFEFGSVPDGENVTLVAIKKENDKLFLDIIDTKINAKPNLIFEFKEVTLQEMKAELSKLNSLFD